MLVFGGVHPPFARTKLEPVEYPAQNMQRVGGVFFVVFNPYLFPPLFGDMIQFII